MPPPNDDLRTDRSNLGRGRFFVLGLLALLLLSFLAIWWFDLGIKMRVVWPYSYRDEGGNAVLVTPEFDLIARDWEWHQGDGFMAGSTVMVLRDFSWIQAPITHPVKKHGNLIELNMGPRPVTIEQGRTLVIGERRIDLQNVPRQRIVIHKNGTLDIKDAPESDHPWDSIEYIRAISEEQSEAIEEAKPEPVEQDDGASAVGQGLPLPTNT